jgi:hypothetical protein
LRRSEAQVDIERARQPVASATRNRLRAPIAPPQRLREGAQRDAPAGQQEHRDHRCVRVTPGGGAAAAADREWAPPADARSFGSVPRTSAYPSMSETS